MIRYLLNSWYAFAFANEVAATQPFARKLLDADLVAYRCTDGKPVVLHDRCPHRFAPLSEGRVFDNDIQCPYHGLRFSPDGACSRNPHARDHGPLRAAKVQSFPVLERYGVIWVWPGEPTAANPAALPAITFLEETHRYSYVQGLIRVRANYQLVVDNLLDLSHAAFIHPEFARPGISAEQALAATTSKLIRGERQIRNERLRVGLPAPPASVELFGVPGDRPSMVKSHMTWHPPAILEFDVGSWEEGVSEQDGVLLPQLHIISPETEFSSHYFFINGRNRRLHDPQVDAALLRVFDRAFRQQDEPIIEFVQRRMGQISDINELHPVLLAIDAAPVAARRMLTRLIEAELAATAANRPA
jgi:phenylpropionate dioxygenase-like ring-hydroxylating dioxygenase large terminal subunit